MELYANVLLITLSGIFVVIMIEALYAFFIKDFNFYTMDTISSLSAGMTNVIKNVLGLTFVFVGYDYFYENIALVQFETTWISYVLTFIALDFASYWYHRLAHHVNIFWNRHVIHHSGEEFNTATGLRQSMSKFVNISVFFLIPAALLGLSPKVIAIVTPLHLFLQFWYHTKHIGKLGWLEYIIVTPSQHRVHHAINTVYMDRNLSAIFCVWDRLFGTFQEELDEEPCVYGVSRQVNSWNPILINFNHIGLLFKDAWRTKSLWDKMRIWFMPTGWRPEDVLEKYPVPYTTPQTFQRYDTAPSKRLKIWSWVQFVVLTGMVLHLLFQIASIGSPSIFVYGAFMFLMIYSYSVLMDNDANALYFEILKSTIGLGIIFYSGDWFLIDSIVYGGTGFVALYFVVSVLVVGYFTKYEINEYRQIAS